MWALSATWEHNISVVIVHTILKLIMMMVEVYSLFTYVHATIPIPSTSTTEREPRRS